MEFLKFNANLWGSSMTYDESSQRTRSQHGIEQRFYRGSRSNHTDSSMHAPKINEKQYQCEWKSSKGKKPVWNRAEVSIHVGAAGWHLWKSMKIKHLWKSMRYDKVFRGQVASLESSKGFYKGSTSNHTVFKNPCPKSMKIYANPWKSHKINENP